MSALDKAAFYKAIRGRLFGTSLDANEVQGCEAVLAALDGLPLSYQAYGLATAYHETAATMLPVREAYWLSEDWRRTNLRYFPYYGRGYVQLTWRENYERADRELHMGGALLANLDKAMDPAIAAKIMRLGMVEGWFSKGKSFAAFLPASGPAADDQFINARRIINGTDKAQLVASYARIFQVALQAGGIAR